MKDNGMARAGVRLGAVALALVGSLAACSPDNSIGPDAVGAFGSRTRPSSGDSGGGGGTDVPAVTGGAGGGGSAGTNGGAGGSGAAGGGGRPGAGGSSGSGGVGPGTGETMRDAGSTATGGAGGGGARPEGGAPVTMPGTTGVIMAGGPSKCPLAGATLCDGFEEAAPGDATSLFKSEPKLATTVVADTSKPYRGTRSVHITFDKPANSQGFITQMATLGGSAKNAMWGRMFVWYEVGAGQAGPAGHFVFMRLEGTPGAGQPAAAAQLHLMGGTRATLATEIRTTSDLYKTSNPAVAVPAAPPRWQCWEWHTTNENTADIYIDGKLVPGLSVTAADKWVFPTMTKMSLGYLDFSAGPSGNMWIDEVAIGDAQIGCDP